MEYVVNRILIWALTIVLAAPALAAGEVRRATLDNGMRVVVVQDTLAPVVSTQLAYIVGSVDSPDGFPGTAHALEHMMFRGSAGLDRDQLFELSALLGGSYNASTAETVTQYTYTVPASDLGLVLRIEALRMRGASITEADWRQERGAIEQEVSRNLSNPSYIEWAEIQAALFAGTPYEHDALGTRPSFEKTDAALLRRTYDQFYAPNNAILIIAGDVQPEQAIAQAQAAFGDIPRAATPAHPVISLPPLQPKTINLPTSAPVGSVTLALRMPGLRAKDFAAADILGDVLGNERSALYGLVPAGKALSARFSFYALADVGMGAATATFPAGSDPAPLLAEMKRVLSDAARGDIAPDLVEWARQAELAQLAFNADSIGGLARIWARTVAVQGLESPDDLARAYQAVTVEDVQRLARQLLDPDHAVTAIMTPGGARGPAGPATFGAAETFATPPDKAVTLPAWAASALADLPATQAATPPFATVLPNGLRLIVQTERVSPTVSVFGRVREVTETEEPPGQEGVSALTGRLFAYGTTTRDRIAFRKAVDDIAAVTNAGSSFSLKVLTAQFAPGMRLLAENVLHPAFPDEAFTVARGQLAQSLAGAVRSPDYLAGQGLNRALLPANDPGLRQATPASVTALTPSDLRAYYTRAFRPDLTTIVVVGDVTAAEAERVVTETFGPWQAAGPTPAIDLPPVGPNPGSALRVPDPGSQQDRVVLSQTLPMGVTSPDRYPLLLGNTILGGGFSSRLYQDLRVRTGYVYSVSSAPDWTRTRGRYTVSFGSDAGNVAPARALVERNIRAMQAGPVSEAELTRAKAQILRQLAMQGASVGGIASQYLRLVDLDLPLDTLRLSAERYRAITAADIQRAFATWLRPDELVQVVKGPPLP